MEEIHRITENFVRAASNAIAAGFDGVELHSAGAYLFDQFVNSGINTRGDEYGGDSIANRLRFLLETVDSVATAIGGNRIGVRIFPWGAYPRCPRLFERASDLPGPEEGVVEAKDL